MAGASSNKPQFLRVYDKPRYSLDPSIGDNGFFNYLNRLWGENSEEGFFVIQPPPEWCAGVKANAEKTLSLDLKVDYFVKKLENLGGGIYSYTLVKEDPTTVKYSKYLELIRRQEALVLKKTRGKDYGTSAYFDSLLGVPLKYAADLILDVFDGQKLWNFNKLKSPLQRLLSEDDNKKVDGIHHSMVYVSGVGSLFPMHTEDCYLASLNYQFFGDRKEWVLVPPSSFIRVKELINEKLSLKYPDVECNRLVHHKFVILSDEFFLGNQLVRYRYTQREGELLVIGHSIFHMGTSSTLNGNVAVNIALSHWPQHAKAALAEPTCDDCAEYPRLSISKGLKQWQTTRAEAYAENRDILGHPYDADYQKLMYEKQKEVLKEASKVLMETVKKNQLKASFSDEEKASLATYIAREALFVKSGKKIINGYGSWSERIFKPRMDPNKFLRRLETQIYKPFKNGDTTFGLSEADCDKLKNKLN